MLPVQVQRMLAPMPTPGPYPPLRGIDLFVSKGHLRLLTNEMANGIGVFVSQGFERRHTLRAKRAAADHFPKKRPRTTP